METPTLNVWVGHSAHENDVAAFFDNKQERMTRVEFDRFDVGRLVFQTVGDDRGRCKNDITNDIRPPCSTMLNESVCRTYRKRPRLPCPFRRRPRMSCV